MTAGTNLIYDFTLLNLVTTPAYNSTYLFEVITYDTDGQRVLEAWSDYITITE